MVQTLKSKEGISKIIWIFLLLNPIFDVITSFSIHYYSHSMFLILGLKFFFLVFLMLLNFHYRNKKSMRYTFFIGGYFLLFFLILFIYKGTAGFFLEAQNLFRTFYFHFVFLFLFSLEQEGVLKVKTKYLCYLLFLYLGFLVVPHFLHLDFQSYAHSKVGSLGWFYSTNEIGGILAILGPFWLSYLKDQNWVLKILGFCFYVLGILVIGTKVPILAFVITIFSFFVASLTRYIKKKEWKQVWLRVGVFGVSSLIFAFVLFSSSFYQNIKIHLDFLEIHRVQDLLTFHHIDHFIFSERLSFLQDTNEIYQSTSISQKLIGMGISSSNGSEVTSMKMIEMDYFDIFYHYGIIGTILFLLPFFLVNLKRKYSLEEKISIGLVLLLALFSGHILVAPSVSLVVAFVLLPKSRRVVDK